MSTVSGAPAPISSSSSTPTQKPSTPKGAEKPKNPDFLTQVVNFFKALFGTRPTHLTSQQKLLVGQSIAGKKLDTIPDRMWKAVGVKQPQNPSALKQQLNDEASFQLLQSAKLISLFTKGNGIVTDGVPAQMKNWCNPLDQTHLGDFMELGGKPGTQEQVSTKESSKKLPYGQVSTKESIEKLHQLGEAIGVISSQDTAALKFPDGEPDLSLSQADLSSFKFVNRYGDVTPKSLNMIRKVGENKTGQVKEAFRQEIKTIENAMKEKKTELCDPGGHLKTIKNALLPKNFSTDFHVDAQKGLVMDAKTGLLANIAFNPKSREMAVNFTGNGILLGKVNGPNSAIAISGSIPANFKHADQMVGALKQHVDALNSKIKNNDPTSEPISLKLTGYCMGGGIAAYVGGKHKIPFDTFNPMPLGLGLQKDMGKDGLEWANANGKRYVMETDRVSDKNNSANFFVSALKSVMGTLNCQSPGETFIVPREYVTREVEGRSGHLQSDVHGLFRHMIENLHKEEGSVIKG